MNETEKSFYIAIMISIFAIGFLLGCAFISIKNDRKISESNIIGNIETQMQNCNDKDGDFQLLKNRKDNDYTTICVIEKVLN